MILKGGGRRKEEKEISLEKKGGPSKTRKTEEQQSWGEILGRRQEGEKERKANLT